MVEWVGGKAGAEWVVGSHMGKRGVRLVVRVYATVRACVLSGAGRRRGVVDAVRVQERCL